MRSPTKQRPDQDVAFPWRPSMGGLASSPIPPGRTSAWERGWAAPPGVCTLGRAFPAPHPRTHSRVGKPTSGPAHAPAEPVLGGIAAGEGRGVSLEQQQPRTERGATHEAGDSLGARVWAGGGGRGAGDSGTGRGGVGRGLHGPAVTPRADARGRPLLPPRLGERPLAAGLVTSRPAPCLPVSGVGSGKNLGTPPPSS